GSRIGLTDPRPSTGIVVADLDADRDADIILIKQAAPHVALVNDRAWRYHRDSRFGTSPGAPIVAGLAGSVQLALADVDGDGRPDLVGTGSDGRVQAVAIPPAGGAAPLFVERDHPVAGWTLAALDATQGPSLVAMPAGTNGAPLLWRPGSGRFPFVTLALSGRDPRGTQIRSNTSGIGTQVAARAGSQWTALANYRSQSGIGQSLQPLSIGAGGRPQ